MLKEKEFRNLFPRGTKLPLVDTIRDTLRVIDLNGLSNINESIIKKLLKIRHLEKVLLKKIDIMYTKAKLLDAEKALAIEKDF